MYLKERKTNFSVIAYAVSAIILLSGGSIIQAAPPWNQIHKLLASDGAANDQFGFSAAISSNTAVIGAYSDDDNGTQSGSAYVFGITTGRQLFKLLASDGAAGDLFGLSVAASGNIAVIGAEGGDDNGTASGSAYVFDVTTGEQLFKLLPSDGATNDRFGTSVAVSGNIAVIGAEGDDDNGTNTGSAYVFDVMTGQQLFKLLATDGAAGDQFGFSVAVSGNIAVIGANADADNGSNSGSTYVFDITTGQQLFKLLPADGAAGDQFGRSVALSGNTAVIGASLGDDDNGTDSGSAYVFDVTTGGQVFKLLAADGAQFDEFGFSVAVSGNTAVIGARFGYGNVADSGSAYVFNVTTGQQLFKLLATDGAVDDEFGVSVALGGNAAVIGAAYDDNGTTDSGSAFVFQQRTTNFLTVSPDPLISGQDATFSLVQTLPNERTWILYSVDGIKQSFIRKLHVFIDINNPKIVVGPRRTDANGDLQLVIPMPPGLRNPVDVWFQAVQNRNVTNFVPTQLIP